MIKAATLIKRKPGFSVADFQDYWLNEHPKVVTALPGIRRYHQSHPLPGGYRKGELIYDGVAEVWADDTAAFREMSTSPAYEAVIADEAVFIDRGAMVLLLVTEHVIKDGPIPRGGVKNIEFVRHKAGMAIPAFQRYWREVHGPIAAEIPMIRRYVQSHTRLAGYDRTPPPAFDGLAITWFKSVAAMREAATTPAYRRTRADEANFIATDRDPPFIITKEHVIVG